MGYRIRMVPEVAGWLGQLRDADPGTAGIVDEALAALRDEGASLGPPVVIPVEVRPEPAGRISIRPTSASWRCWLACAGPWPRWPPRASAWSCRSTSRNRR